MRPSIMSDGATMSAPASAWTSAWRTRISTVSSFRIRPSRISPSWPWLVKGSRATSTTMPRSGTAALIARDGAADQVAGPAGLGAVLAAQGPVDHREQRHRRDAEVAGAAAGLGGAGQVEAGDPRQRFDRLLGRPRPRRSARSGRTGPAGSRPPARGSSRRCAGGACGWSGRRRGRAGGTSGHSTNGWRRLGRRRTLGRRPGRKQLRAARRHERRVQCGEQRNMHAKG